LEFAVGRPDNFVPNGGPGLYLPGWWYGDPYHCLCYRNNPSNCR
jgi:hypothetical protein